MLIPNKTKSKNIKKKNNKKESSPKFKKRNKLLKTYNPHPQKNDNRKNNRAQRSLAKKK